MKGIVLDASVTMAWAFPDERVDDTVALLESLKTHSIYVPAIWPLEVANALLVALKRQRISETDLARFRQLLASLNVKVATVTVNSALAEVLTLAREVDLSVYDASYVELAIREEVPIASLDQKLKTAALSKGVPVFQPTSTGQASGEPED